jgi:hypothetical protein
MRQFYQDRIGFAARAAPERRNVPGYEGCRPRRVIGFAAWDSLPDWEVIHDETFHDQQQRLRAILAIADDSEEA